MNDKLITPVVHLWESISIDKIIFKEARVGNALKMNWDFPAVGVTSVTLVLTLSLLSQCDSKQGHLENMLF